MLSHKLGFFYKKIIPSRRLHFFCISVPRFIDLKGRRDLSDMIEFDLHK